MQAKIKNSGIQGTHIDLCSPPSKKRKTDFCGELCDKEELEHILSASASRIHGQVIEVDDAESPGRTLNSDGFDSNELDRASHDSLQQHNVSSANQSTF